jgi:hypothetical protein
MGPPNLHINKEEKRKKQGILKVSQALYSVISSLMVQDQMNFNNLPRQLRESMTRYGNNCFHFLRVLITLKKQGDKSLDFPF